jgi:hypothetical protein
MQHTAQINQSAQIFKFFFPNRSGPTTCVIPKFLYSSLLDPTFIYDAASAMSQLSTPFCPRHSLLCEGSDSEKRFEVVKRNNVAPGEYGILFLALRVESASGVMDQARN